MDDPVDKLMRTNVRMASIPHNEVGFFSAVETDEPGLFQQASYCPHCSGCTFRRYHLSPAQSDELYLFIRCDHCGVSSFCRGEFDYAS